MIEKNKRRLSVLQEKVNRLALLGASVAVVGVIALGLRIGLGFRGKDMDQANPDLEIIHRSRIKTMTNPQRRWLKRGQAVEPAIGHLKSDNRMQRCWLQGAVGDALHALCCAVGYNLRWLMRAVVRLGLKGVLLCLLWLAYWARLSLKKTEVGRGRFLWRTPALRAYL